MKKKWNLFVSLINLIYENTIDCEIACDCVKPANMVVGLWKEIFARTHSYPQADMCSAPYSNHDDTHLIIVCGAPRPQPDGAITLKGNLTQKWNFVSCQYLVTVFICH